MNWHKREIESADVRALSTRYGIDLLSASILLRRGRQQPDELRYFLESDPIFLHNPFLFEEMDDVVDRILAAKEEGERVKVFGDRDADGITSTVLITQTLTEMGIDVEWAVPQGDDPYGLTNASIDEFAERNGTLQITVDCGISNHREIEYATEKGIDTIVIDHHNPQEQLPPAFAIINPKTSDCGYPFRDLAGCGVTAKVIWALEFGRTELYNHPVCLLNVRPGNETLILEAVLLVNLIEVDRLVENIVPGMVDVDHTRLTHFLTGRELFVYNESAQYRFMREIFGSDTDIGLTDISQELWKQIPKMRDASLLRLANSSRSLRYETGEIGELDVLKRLFESYVIRSKPELSTEYLRHLDLVALGTLADLMPLVDENRILVRAGLSRMNTDPRPALHDLFVRQHIDGKTISTMDIGWQISPLINATGRLGVPDRAVELFLCDDGPERVKLVDEIFELNRERKKLGEKAWDGIIDDARTSYQDNDSRVVQVGSRDIHRGITGIIATRLVKFFNVPAFVVSLLEDRAIGSARSVEGINIREFLDNFEDLFIDYGGHDYAAGYSMKRELYSQFQDRFREMSAHIARNDQDDLQLDIDAELPANYFTPALVNTVEKLEPYGEGNPAIIFSASGVVIEEMQLIGKREQNHLRLLINSGAHKWPAVFWNSAERINKDFALGDRVDIAFRLGRNYYQRQEKIQLTILDIRR
jgi:single-stranded-DNA-specific exonuclease